MSAFTIYKGVNPLDLPKRMRFNALENLHVKIETFFGTTVYIQDFHYVAKRNSYAIILNNGAIYESSDKGATWVNVCNIAYGYFIRFLDDDYVGGCRRSATGSYYATLYNYTTGTLVEELASATNIVQGISVDKANNMIAFIAPELSYERGRAFVVCPYFTGSKILKVKGNYFYDTLDEYLFGEHLPKTGFFGISLKNNVLAVAYGGGLYVKDIISNNVRTSTLRPKGSGNYCYYLNQDSDHNLYCTLNSYNYSKLNASDYTNNSWVSGETLGLGGPYVGGLYISDDNIYTWDNYSYSPDGYIYSSTDYATKASYGILDNMLESTLDIFGSAVKSFWKVDSTKYAILTTNSQILLYVAF